MISTKPTGYDRRVVLVLVILLMTMRPPAVSADPATGPLEVHPDNPRYFSDGSGKAVFLTGSHVWTNLQDEVGQPLVDFTDHLDVLQSYGHNFTRGWHWEDAYYAPLPYARTGPGNANDGGLKFDLTQYNQSYFDRIRARAIEAGNRGMYISIMLFEGWSIDTAYSPGRPGGYRNPNPWPYHPYNIENNINGIDGGDDDNDDGGATHRLEYPAITALQEAYVNETIDQLNDLDNIIWEISNESRAYSAQWQYHMVNHIRAREATEPKQHLIWMNARGDWNNSALFASPADIISPNNNSGTDYINNPPATTGNKVILLDTDHLVGVGADWNWVWKSVARGYQPIYMDPLYPISWSTNNWNPDNPQYIAARHAMGSALAYVERMNLADTVPQASTASMPCSTQYCLYQSGLDYLAYQPAGGAFTVELPSGEYDYEWFNPANHTLESAGFLRWDGGSRSFTPPISGAAVLFLHRLWDLGIPGDFDRDGDIDQADFGVLQVCLSGPTIPVQNGCEQADLNQDGVADQQDVEQFLQCMNGTGNPPGC